MEEKIGLFIGRFQPFHHGHLSIVREALKKCDRLIIAVGSSQESRTKRNPFNFEERKEFIWRGLKGLNNKVIIIPVPDRPIYGDDASWGQYVLECVEAECGLRPTINFEGEEVCRSTWFDGLGIERVSIDRTLIPYSATEVRESIKNSDYFVFCDMVPTGLWIEYEKMRKLLWR